LARPICTRPVVARPAERAIAKALGIGPGGAARTQREVEQITLNRPQDRTVGKVMIKTEFGQKVALPTGNPSRKKEETP